METYQERVYEEKKELDLKIEVLREFLNNSYAGNDMQELDFLRIQYQLMKGYSNILNERIKLWKKP
jgi:hypothetical protein